jgi:DNA-binding transcriptional LysR family regulator
MDGWWNSSVDLSLLRTFVAVYRAGSLTAAAATLGLSQPTVTAQIRTLETRLEQQLFRRLARGVAPTSIADELVRQVAPHVDALQAVAERGLAPREPLGKPVRLAGPAELVTARVLPCLAELVSQGLKLRISFGGNEELLNRLSSGQLDLVIANSRPRSRAITATELTDEEFVLVAAAQWSDQIDHTKLATDPAATLRNVPLVSYAEDLPVIRRYWRTAFGVRPAGAAAVVVPDLRGVLSATIAGCGITVLPRHLCAPALHDGTLVALLEPDVPPVNTLYLATRTGTTDLPHIAAVHEQLREKLHCD